MESDTDDPGRKDAGGGRGPLGGKSSGQGEGVDEVEKTANKRWFLNPQAGGGMCHPFPDLPGFCVSGQRFRLSWKQPERTSSSKSQEGLRLDRRFHRIGNIEQIPTSSHRWMECASDRCPCSCGPGSGDTRRDNSAAASRFLSRLAKKPDHSRPSPRRRRAGRFSLSNDLTSCTRRNARHRSTILKYPRY